MPERSALAIAASVILGLAGLVLAGLTAPAGADGVAGANAASTEKLAAAHFVEPLVRTAPTTAAEDRALLRAVAAYERRGTADDLSSLTGFLSAHPRSGWRVALLTDLGFSDLHYGYLSRTVEAWEAAWHDGKTATEPHARALVDRVVGELARLHAGLGHVERLSALLDEIGNRPVSGPATEAVQIAREELWAMRNDPKHLFLCGPMALKAVMRLQRASAADTHFLDRYRADGPKGVSLADLARLAEQGKLAYRPMFRKPGQPVPVPSIVHWKIGHFGAIVGEAGGRFHVVDPSFGQDGLWVTRAALDAEASGYFLAPIGNGRGVGWHGVALADAGRVWGAGITPGGPRPGDVGDPPADPPPGDCPMCGYNIKELTVGLTLTDAPVGYTPPIGPAAKVRLTYNQREDSQPANFNFFNISPKWTLNWLSYVQDDPTSAGSNVTRYLSDGGAFYYSGYNSTSGAFTAQDDDASVLVLMSKNPVSYQRLLNDGSVEIYSQSDGSATFPRHVFLTRVIDPQGNALSLSYDSQLRLTALTDATGRQTTFAYGRSNSPLLITAITDPFGRTASLVYNDSGHLFSITDVLGLTSNFAYDSSGLVNSMTTPYGTTQFAYGQNPANLYRWLQITDPLGLNEREETLQPTSVAGSDASVPSGFPLYNAYLNYRDSFHWDKHAYTIAGCTASGGCNYNDARARHFLHDSSNVNIESSVTEALQYPLESRIWFGYPGQSQPYFSGTYDQPSGIARLLDNGGTQLKQFAYNGFGRTTQAVDPVGRTTNFTYAANLIDLTKVTQNTASGAATIAQFTWNSQHRPLTYTDAAGQVWQYAYNAARQPVSATNPLSQTTTYQYNTLGYLTGIFQGRTTLASLTRDAFGRVATYTDAGGWTVSYNYDAADRVTKITYPDGTFDQYTWNKLDLAEFQDRQSNSWNYGHDADRRLTSVADPLNNQTQFGYWENGRLRSLLDPKGNLTVWDIDVEGRPTIKQYADSTTVSYAYENTTSRLKSVIDALGQTKQYAYAADDRVSGISYLNPVNPTPNVGFGWDSYFPRLTAMTDGTGTTQYSYMAPGTLGALLLQQETGAPPAGAIAYAYDALGRVASRSIGGIVQETFQYDALSRLVTHADGLGQFALSYLGETGQIAQRQASISAGTWATSWSYLENTGDRRLASVHSSGLGPVVGQHSYTTTAEDFASAVAESCSPTPCGSGWTYSYDAADRLTSGYPIGAASAYAYTLDPAGNISLFQSPYAPSEQATYSNVNALTNFAGQAFSYDANGNLTSDGQRSYAWDAENRLVAIGYAAQPGKQTSFAYDGLGRRSAITTTVSGTASTTYYLWCGSQLCQAVNPSGTVARSYFAEGEAVVVPPPATAALYYGPDRLGSVRDVAAVSGATVAQQVYTYDPYGNPLQRPEGSVLTDRRFAGMFYHADSGLYLTRTRAYNPATGRWLSRDPLGEGTDPAANLYRYVVNNPTNLTDPLGLGWTITFGGPPPAGDPFPNNPNPLPPRPGDPNVPCPTVLRGGGGDPGGGADPGGGDPGLVPVADPGPPPLTDPGSAPGIPDAGNPWVLAGPPTPDASATPAPFQPAAFTPSPKQPPCSGPNSDCAKTPGFGRGMGALLDPLNPGKFLCPDCFGKTYGPPTDEDWDR